ncbi:MAG: hypothetical protein FWC02_00535 [Firmicutes bacterium]|nr:hypothetical protein [Bacillota bacterium]
MIEQGVLGEQQAELMYWIEQQLLVILSAVVFLICPARTAEQQEKPASKREELTQPRAKQSIFEQTPSTQQYAPPFCVKRHT